MQSFELEEMALFLIRDADEAEMWIDRWAVSYPIVHTAEADSRQTISEWQHSHSDGIRPYRQQKYCRRGSWCRRVRIFGMAVPSRHHDAKTPDQYYFGLAASRSFSRGRNPYVPTRPLPLPYSAGYRRNKRHATRLGARTG